MLIIHKIQKYIKNTIMDRARGAKRSQGVSRGWGRGGATRGDGKGVDELSENAKISFFI